MKNRSFWWFYGILSLYWMGCASFDAHACVRMPDSDLSLVGSYENGATVSHGRGSKLELRGCKDFAGQYLVLVSAPVYTDPQFKSIASAEGETPDDRCYIDQTPFDVSKPADVHIDEFYQQQTTLLNSCLDTEVTDESGNIDAKTQVNCEIIPIDKGKVIARGPRCSFKIQENSNFKVAYRMNPDCVKKSHLKEAGNLRPMDIKASFEVYRAADLTPGNPDYILVTSTNARVTLLPDKGLLPVSLYTGTPASQWPMQYGTQVEMGRVALNRVTMSSGAVSYILLKVPFLVDNNCAEVCKDGLCTSPCDYFAPVAARMSVAKKSASEENFHGIDYWYQGNIVPPRFLGEISLGKMINDPGIAVGDHYLVTAEFSNPALTYQTLTDEAKQLLIKLQPVKIPLQSAGRPQGLQALAGLTNMIPDLMSLPPMKSLMESQDGEVDLGPILRTLTNYLGSDDSWPPYYNQVIHEGLTDNANRVYLKLKVGFRVAKITPSGGAVLDHIVYFKESKIFGNYEKPMTVLPQIKCDR